MEWVELQSYSFRTAVLILSSCYRQVAWSSQDIFFGSPSLLKKTCWQVELARLNWSVGVDVYVWDRLKIHHDHDHENTKDE